MKYSMTIIIKQLISHFSFDILQPVALVLNVIKKRRVSKPHMSDTVVRNLSSEKHIVVNSS